MKALERLMAPADLDVYRALRKILKAVADVREPLREKARHMEGMTFSPEDYASEHINMGEDAWGELDKALRDISYMHGDLIGLRLSAKAQRRDDDE